MKSLSEMTEVKNWTSSSRELVKLLARCWRPVWRSWDAEDAKDGVERLVVESGAVAVAVETLPNVRR